MATRKELLEAVVDQIADYREGEIDAIGPAHVDRWVRQFPDATQNPLLAELAHVFSKTYFKRTKITKFLAKIATDKKFNGDDPVSFWKRTSVLDIQTVGNSQHEMLTILDNALQKSCGLSLSQCGKEAVETYLYVDDVLFSGGRVKYDIVRWIKSAAPQRARLAIIVIAFHQLGQWRTSKAIHDAAREVGKTIEVTWWRVFDIEDRKSYIDNSDVLRPVELPTDEATRRYVAGLKMEQVFRTPGKVGELGFFSSEAGRNLLEQQFLVSGVQVRTQCRYLNEYMRPLGNSIMGIMGFGSMIVTYRNCPNNAPLVLWVGNPWYPLFPRKTN